MLNKPCLVCGTLTRTPSRCDACQKIWATTRENNRDRLSAHRRGYDAQWRALRIKILRRDSYTCGYCGKNATTVDHIKPLSTHPELRLTESNLISACISCNSSKRDK